MTPKSTVGVGSPYPALHQRKAGKPSPHVAIHRW